MNNKKTVNNSKVKEEKKENKIELNCPKCNTHLYIELEGDEVEQYDEGVKLKTNCSHCKKEVSFRKQTYTGIEGWLAFFLYLSFPLSQIITIVLSISAINETGFNALYIIDLALLIYGIIAWILLLNKNKIGVYLMRAYLTIEVVIVLVSMWPGGEAPSSFWLFIWCIYFFVSKRVKNTYGFTKKY